MEKKNLQCKKIDSEKNRQREKMEIVKKNSLIKQIFEKKNWKKSVCGRNRELVENSIEIVEKIQRKNIVEKIVKRKQ